MSLIKELFDMSWETPGLGEDVAPAGLGLLMASVLGDAVWRRSKLQEVAEDDEGP